MLRYFYIIYLLLCMEWTTIMCYGYNGPQHYRHIDTKVRRSVRSKHQNLGVRRKKSVDRNPVAQFDVASFIQNTNEEAVEDNAPYDRNKKRERTLKDYSDYGALIDINVPENIKKRGNIQDYLSPGPDDAAELNISPLQLRDTINGRHFNFESLSSDEGGKFDRNRDDNVAKSKYNDELLMGKNLIHSPEKKCTFKNMKFPFFSHNKSEIQKKEKKRKMFCFNCSKKDPVSKSPEVYETKNKSKRSYENKLCPACKRQLTDDIADTKQKHVTNKLIHNSRQFYEEVDNRAKWKSKRLQYLNDIENYNNRNVNNIRKKREEEREGENERQLLKKLEEIQKKIDDVEISMPNFEKPSN